MADGLHGHVLLQAVAAVEHAGGGRWRRGGGGDGARAGEFGEALDAVVERRVEHRAIGRRHRHRRRARRRAGRRVTRGASGTRVSSGDMGRRLQRTTAASLLRHLCLRVRVEQRSYRESKTAIRRLYILCYKLITVLLNHLEP